MEENLKDLLVNGAKEFSVELDEQQVGQFSTYKDILKEWNEKINLTAIEEDKDIIIKHFIDSLSIVPHLNKFMASSGSRKANFNLIDVGTGAGFPGIPLKIADMELKVVLLDSLDKRVKFLKEVIDKLSLKGIDAFHGRAEEYGINKDYRENFDISVARAVANLPVLLEYCLPYVRTNGIFIAMKGSSIEEIEASKKALQLLGGEIEEICEMTLPFSDMKRNIIVVRKLRQTSSKYPRKAGKPSKEPLI